MKKALIPALVVVCGAMASLLWHTVELRCTVSEIEIVGAIANPLLRCFADELFTSGLTDLAIETGTQRADRVAHSGNLISSVLLRTLLHDRFDGLAPETRKNNCPGVSISRWLVRHTVVRRFSQLCEDFTKC